MWNKAMVVSKGVRAWQSVSGGAGCEGAVLGALQVHWEGAGRHVQKCWGQANNSVENQGKRSSM